MAANSVQHKLKCRHESDFVQMNNAANSSVIQNSIRDRNPEGKHCQLLIELPSACKGCVFSPFGHLKMDQPEAGWIELSEAALELESAMIITPFDPMPEQFTALRVVRQFLEHKNAELLGKYVGVEVSKILARAFGGPR